MVADVTGPKPADFDGSKVRRKVMGLPAR